MDIHGELGTQYFVFEYTKLVSSMCQVILRLGCNVYYNVGYAI
jgi:hypothetical protein